jgi:hypothetical protein
MDNLTKDELLLIYSGLELYWKSEKKLENKPYNKMDQIQELRKKISELIKEKSN